MKKRRKKWDKKIKLKKKKNLNLIKSKNRILTKLA